jgi:hypothetical protein
MDNHPFQEDDNQIQGHFEDVGDLNEVQQENINQGWEQPPPPPHENAMEWAPWPQVDNAVVDENEVDLINNLADIAVAKAVSNGLMQHPKQPQDSSSVSSGTQAFFSTRSTYHFRAASP